MFTVNAEQTHRVFGMMSQEMRMDMCMHMSMFCYAFMFQSLPEASAVSLRAAGGAGL